MPKKITALLIEAMAILCLLCGCGEHKSAAEETVTAAGSSAAVFSEVRTESVTVTETFAEDDAEIITVTFPKAEKFENAVYETETSAQTEETEEEKVLAANQLEYRGKNIYIFMEFTGAEQLEFYPRAWRYPSYQDDDYVLHSHFEVTNLSEKSFDFVPQKLVIYGQNKNKSRSMSVNAVSNELVSADGCYTLEPESSVSFDVDFVGDKVCIEYADEIKYGYHMMLGLQNVDTDDLNDAAVKEFDITKRIAVKKAVSAALEISKEKYADPEELVPIGNEFSVVTETNSYCFTVRPIDNGKYVRASFRMQCLTGEPQKIEPIRFKLQRKNGGYDPAHVWSFDEALAGSTPKLSENVIKDAEGTLYESPMYLYVRPDGSAEFTMYFLTANYELSDYDKISYDGGSDSFEYPISLV